MRTSLKFLSIAVSLFAVTAVSVGPAMAKCTRLAFSVNDYGKIEPARDAKRMLDGYIAKWTAERGISGYRTGKKSVNCELFIDLIVFDEYTCRAEATVCWGGSTPSGGTASGTGSSDAAPAAPATTGSVAPAAKPSAVDDAGGRYVSGE